jgi:signal transduction histidine kinase
VRDLTIYILLGLVLGVTFLTVSLIGVMHQRVALYYAAYVVGATVHFCYVLDLFRPSPILLSMTEPFRSYLWWAGISLLCYMLFQRAFFSNEGRIGNGLRRSFAAAIIVNVVLLLAHGLFQFPYMYYIAWTMICMLFIAANGIVAVTRKITGGWFFALGCVSITFMVAPITLSDFMTAHYTYEEASMVFLYGLALEAIALSCAMFLKVREIRVEREDALLSELRLTNEKLEASRKLASAAHDIQQPLSSLRMALTNPNSDANKHGKIDQAIDYLDEIVRTQMAETKHDLTNYEEPKISNIEDFEIDLIFNNLLSMFADEAQAKGLSLRVAPTSKRATTSPLGLMRILSNLVSNAIKNTQTGGVLVGCRHNNSHIRIDVCDTGPGLTPTQLQELKQLYQRNADYDGQGLGLSIVQQLCDEYGMRLRVSSELNQGTVFHVTIPVEHP